MAGRVDSKHTGTCTNDLAQTVHSETGLRYQLLSVVHQGNTSILQDFSSTTRKPCLAIFGFSISPCSE